MSNLDSIMSLQLKLVKLEAKVVVCVPATAATVLEAVAKLPGGKIKVQHKSTPMLRWEFILKLLLICFRFYVLANRQVALT